MFLLKDYDFKKHNEEVKKVWDAFEKKQPIRMPVLWGINPRVVLQNKKLNTENDTFRRYFDDPAVMLKIVTRFRHYLAHNILADHPMGVPEDGWDVHVDFQNVLEPAWFGCPVEFPDGFPCCERLLTDDTKNMLFEKGLPSPFSGLFQKAREYYEYFSEEKKKGTLFCGAPIHRVYEVGLGTDGPMTIACTVRGATELCTEMIEEPEYVHRLFDYITQAVIGRITAWRKYHGLPEKSDNFGFADDSIALLSPAMYREFILPYHKKILQAVCTPDAKIGIHLCGDATRHFKCIQDELNVVSYDTGYPIDHAKMLQILRPGTIILGGPHVGLLEKGAKAEVIAETRRIMDAVMPHSRFFIMRDANNVPPNTPEENLNAVYQTVREHGWY